MTETSIQGKQGKDSPDPGLGGGGGIMELTPVDLVPTVAAFAITSAPQFPFLEQAGGAGGGTCRIRPHGAAGRRAW